MQLINMNTVATSIYQTVFNNSLKDWTVKLVPQAAVAAGLPESKLADLMTAVASSPATLSQSFSAAVATAALDALNQAYCKAIL
jgi:hypothetical protein